MGEEWIANKCKKVIKRKGKSGVTAYISKPGEERLVMMKLCIGFT